MCSLHKNIKTHNLLSLSVFHHLNILISYVCARTFRSVSSSEQTVQFIPLSSFLWTSKPVDWVLLFLVIIYIHIGRRYQHVLAFFALLTGVILKGPTLRKFVSDVCVCMFYVCEVTGFVDWLDRGLIYICEKSLEMCICLWPEFDCPEVTLCGWQDIKIQLLLLLLADNRFPLIPPDNSFPLLHVDNRFSLLPADNRFSLIPLDNSFPLLHVDNRFSLIPLDNSFSLIPLDNGFPLLHADNRFSLLPADNRFSLIPVDSRFPLIL